MITCKNNFGEVVTLPKEKFKFRPSVYGIIRNGGKVCVCNIKSTDKFWFPGGGIDVGESREEALTREIVEETGLKNVKIGKLLDVFENFYYYQPTDNAMHAYLFFYECETDEVVFQDEDKIQDDEANHFRWIEAKEIKKDDLTDLNEQIFELLKRF